MIPSILNFEEAVAELQRQLATVDLHSTSSSRGHTAGMELLLLKRGELKVKMYQEPGHALPHVHVDYGKHHHIASYSIDPAARLVGNHDRLYDRAITEWIRSRTPQLLNLWRATQIGENTNELIVALAGET